VAGKVIPHKDGKKFCSSCLEWIPLSGFAKREASYDKLMHKCKPCGSARAPSKVMAYRRSLYAEGKSICFTCAEIKSLGEFYPDKTKWNGVTGRCRPCQREVMSDYARRSRTGWSREEYEEAHRSQDGRCAICKKPESSIGRNGEVLALAADHCHATGKKRGLLCRRCNQVLGKFEDDPKLLRAAAHYLEFGVADD
jgi:hypothetical protein